MTSEKPPLLTDKQIDEAIFSVDKRHSLKAWWSGDPELRAIAQAQLDADWGYLQSERAEQATDEPKFLTVEFLRAYLKNSRSVSWEEFIANYLSREDAK